jgi:putative acetyltransferase
MTYAIRPEQDSDVAAVRRLIGTAFETAEHRSGTEAAIVDALRSANALTISLVAFVDDDLLGHAACSPVSIDGTDLGWFGLGPVAVAFEHRSKGIGEALVRQCLSLLIARGAKGCVVLGDPAYYGRFGFKADGRLTLSGVPAEYFQSLSFGSELTSGEVNYHRAFATA